MDAILAFMIDAKEQKSWREVREELLADISDEAQGLAFDCHRNTLRNWEENESALSDEASILRRLSVCAELDSLFLNEDGSPRPEPTKLLENAIEQIGRLQAMKRAKASSGEIKAKAREFRLWVSAVGGNAFEKTLGFRFPESDVFEPEALKLDAARSLSENPELVADESVSEADAKKSEYAEEMERDGMWLPFATLCQGKAEDRLEVGRILGVSMNQESAERGTQAAYKLITAHVWGLQAQGNTFFESISPGTANVTYQELLRRVSKEFKAGDPESDWGLEDLQAHAANAVAKSVVEKLVKKDPELAKKAETLAEEEGFAKFLERLPIAINATSSTAKLLAIGIAKAAASEFGTYITAVKIAAWLNANIGAKIAMSTATAFTSTVLRSLSVYLWAWLAVDVLRWIFGQNLRKAGLAVLQIYFLWLAQNAGKANELGGESNE